MEDELLTDLLWRGLVVLGLQLVLRILVVHLGPGVLATQTEKQTVENTKNRKHNIQKIHKAQ